MKKIIVFLTMCVVVFLIIFAVAVLAYAADWRNNPSVSVFYSQLLPHGDWVVHVTYGQVWRPRHVSVGWRPYTHGYWVLTEYGWTWVSDEPWGWACYHYGRWFFDETHGWLWYPGSVWGPAWVVWRYGDSWIGWAPLHPQLPWDPYFGFRFTYTNIGRLLPRHSYCFVQARHFTARDISRRISAEQHDSAFLEKTKIFADYRRQNGRITNSLPIEREIERESGQRIERRRVTFHRAPEGTVVNREEVRIFKPEQVERIERGEREVRQEQVQRTQERKVQAPVLEQRTQRIEQRTERLEQRRTQERKVEAPRIEQRRERIEQRPVEQRTIEQRPAEQRKVQQQPKMIEQKAPARELREQRKEQERVQVQEREKVRIQESEKAQRQEQKRELKDEKEIRGQRISSEGAARSLRRRSAQRGEEQPFVNPPPRPRF